MSSTKIIAALGYASGLKWSMCDACYLSTSILDPGGIGRISQCAMIRGHDGLHDTGRWSDDHGNKYEGCMWSDEDKVGAARPGRPLPSTLEAWAAEWEHERPGELGPVAEWRSPDGRTWWCVNEFGVCVSVGVMGATRSLLGEWDIGGSARQGDPAPQELTRIMANVDRSVAV